MTADYTAIQCIIYGSSSVITATIQCSFGAAEQLWLLPNYGGRQSSLVFSTELVKQDTRGMTDSEPFKSLCVRVNTCPGRLSGSKILSRASLNLLSLPAALTSYSTGSRKECSVGSEKEGNEPSAFAMQNYIEKPRVAAHTSLACVFALDGEYFLERGGCKWMRYLHP